MKPVYIVIGIPGSGKNTQGERLAAHLQIPHIDAGFTFGAIVAQKIEPYWSLIEETYKSSQPIPSEFFLKIIKDKMHGHACHNGFVFTQNTKSVEEIGMMLAMFKEEGFNLTKVFALEISRDTAIARNVKRLNGVFTDKDSSLEVLTARIDTYCRIYPGIRNFYRENGLLVPINAEQDIETVFQIIKDKLTIE